MIKALLFTFLILSPNFALSVNSDLQINAKDSISQETKTVLEGLLKKYDLKRYIYTKEIHIESKVIPHSHPVLTLQAEEKDKPDELLGTFIHEQMHWYWIEASPGKDIGPRVDFKKKFPTAPIKLPEGSGDESSTYQHLGICWLEYQGLIQTVGPERAKKVLSQKHYYTWIYSTVLNNTEYIGQVMKKYNMDNPTGAKSPEASLDIGLRKAFVPGSDQNEADFPAVQVLDPLWLKCPSLAGT
jgi:hypothetical protein